MSIGCDAGESPLTMRALCPSRCYDPCVSRILIAEDTARLASFLDKGLRAAGYTTTVCTDGLQAAAMARDEDFDLLLLDIGLPGQDGFGVLRDLRAREERLPVLVLTARHMVDDVIAALESGADDYLTKPFHFDELMARVRARVRADPGASVTALEHGELRLDLGSRRVTVGDEEVTVTARELQLLETFMRGPGEAFSRDELLSRVWGRGADVGSNVVDVYVGYLRRKLGSDRFESVRGFGYRLRG